MGNATHMHILPRQPKAGSWTKTDFSSGREQSGRGVIVQCEHKYKYEMNALEERWKQIRVNILSLPTNQLLPPSLCGAVVTPQSLSTRDKGGKRTWPSNPDHCGALTSHGVTNRLLFGFKTTKAPSRFIRGPPTKIRTPREFSNSKMQIVACNWPYWPECNF